MSLPNPDSVVTEQRLSEFYTGIRPYLGGMPDIYSNAFSKCNIYSEDEKLVGVWVNGKPLYQKTIVKNNVRVSGSETQIQHGIENLEDIVNCVGYLSTTESSYDRFFEGSIRCYARPTYFTIMVSSSWDAKDYRTWYFTLWYTKSTDSVVSIGSDTDYSTDEKIIGTWIDNSPLYQKTVPTNESVPSGATLVLRTAMASTGYDTILYTKA